MSMIEGKNITVRYGSRTILRDIDFRALAGKVTVIAGPNGSGKSTLVKAISGEVAASGHVALNGRPLSSYKAWQLAALRGVLAQETNVAFAFTVSDIVGLGVTAGLMSGPKARGLVERALARVGLQGFGERRIQTLSGGERQRVQLARVLCQIWEPIGNDGPRWLIMDEPVASLDIRHQIALMDLARDYASAGGGVVAVMHDLNLSAMYADAIVLMKSGSVAASGSPETVLRASVLAQVFDCPLQPNITPGAGTFVLPQSAFQAAPCGLAAE